MNIFILTCEKVLAGSTNSISYLSKGLALRGHRVVLGCPEGSLFPDLLKDTPVIIEKMTFRSKLDRQNIRHIKEIVQKYDIQIINAQSTTDRYTTILAKWRYNLKVLIYHTRRQYPLSVGGWLQNTFYVKGTDKIIAITPSLKEVFVKKGIPENHIHVIYNGLPKARFAQADDQKTESLRQKYGLKPQDKVIGCVSRPKKQDQIIRALPYLNDESIKVIFAGVPTGKYDDIIQELDIKNEIIYAGIVAGNEIMSYYKLFDVSILASITDGFGLVLLEAMGQGIPVIGTKAQGIMDVLENQKNGLWFEHEHIKKLAECIKIVLYDDAKRQELIKNGKIAAFETFSITRTIENYERFFAQELETKYQ